MAFDNWADSLTDPDLIAHWNGDANGDGTGDADDAAGSFDGTWSGTAAYANAQNVGKAFSFGGSSMVAIADGTSLGLAVSSGAFSVFLTCRPTATSGVQMLWESGGGSHGQCIYLDGSDLTACIVGSSSPISATLIGAATAGELLQVLAVFDLSGNLTLYADGGSETASLGALSRPNAGGNAGGIGRVNSTTRLGDGTELTDGEAPYTGTIEDVRIYLRALNAAEKTILFEYVPPTYEEVIANAKFDAPGQDDADDTVIVNNAGPNATLVGGGTTAARSVEGPNYNSPKAIGLNGTSNYVSIPTAGMLRGVSSATLAIRFKVASAPAANAPLIFVSRNGSDLQFRFGIQMLNNGKLQAGGRASDADSFKSTGITASSYADDVWHEAVAQVDYAAGTMVLYIDEVSVATGSSLSFGDTITADTEPNASNIGFYDAPSYLAAEVANAVILESLALTPEIYAAGPTPTPTTALLVALKCNDNEAASANVANTASATTFILKDNGGNLNTADRSQPAAETPFNDRHFALTGDDRVTGALNWAAATEMTAGGYFGSNQINTLGAQLFILDTDPFSGNYAVSVSSDDGSLTGGGRLRVIIKAANGSSLVDIVTNDRIFIDAAMHFVVITYDQVNGCRVFVDGGEQTLTGTNTVGTIRSVTDGTLQLGSRENGTNPANTAKFYNYKLYDRVLSAAEQTAWMAERGAIGNGIVSDIAQDIVSDLVTDIAG